MRCSEFPGFEPGRVLALLLVGIFWLPIADAATDSSTEPPATEAQGSETQGSDAPQGSGSGEAGASGQSEGSGEKNSDESEEEPDC